MLLLQAAGVRTFQGFRRRAQDSLLTLCSCLGPKVVFGFLRCPGPIVGQRGQHMEAKLGGFIVVFLNRESCSTEKASSALHATPGSAEKILDVPTKEAAYACELDYDGASNRSFTQEEFHRA